MQSVIFQHSVALCRSDFGVSVSSVCNVVHCSSCYWSLVILVMWVAQEAITTRERKLHYSEQQGPEIQQPIHLKMAI
jgi:hypothetical protein